MRKRTKRDRSAAFNDLDGLNEKGQCPHRPKKKVKKEEEINPLQNKRCSNHEPTVMKANLEDNKSQAGSSVLCARTTEVTYLNHGPKMKYVMDCDEDGVPAARPAYRPESAPITHTIRDQTGNPLFRRDVIREETPLDVFLRNEHESRMKDLKARSNPSRFRRGGFHKRSPERSGRVLQISRSIGKGKGTYHKKSRPARMPMRNFGFGRSRG